MRFCWLLGQGLAALSAHCVKPGRPPKPRRITHPRWRDAGGWWQHPQRIGPFPFTRGPAYFVGAGIVRQLLDEVGLQAHMRATLDAADGATNLSTTLPWEDVYSGLALSEAAHGADLAYVFCADGAAPAINVLDRLDLEYVCTSIGKNLR